MTMLIHLTLQQWSLKEFLNLKHITNQDNENHCSLWSLSYDSVVVTAKRRTRSGQEERQDEKEIERQR